MPFGKRRSSASEAAGPYLGAGELGMGVVTGCWEIVGFTEGIVGACERAWLRALDESFATASEIGFVWSCRSILGIDKTICQEVGRGFASAFLVYLFEDLHKGPNRPCSSGELSPWRTL